MDFITSEEDIKIKDNIQAFYFYASWMPFHKKMMIMIDKVEKKHKIEFQAIDTDTFIKQCKRFKIDQIPTVLILKNGLEIKRLTGMLMTSAFTSAFNDIFKAGDKDEQK